LRKGLAERSVDQEGTPGAVAASNAGRVGMLPVLAIVILIVIAVVAGIAARGPRLSMPESMAGHSRLHGAQFAQLQESAKSELGGNPVVGVFGISNQPSFMVAGFDQTLGPGEDLFSEIERALGQGLGGAEITFDTGAGTTRTIRSVAYSCVPYSIPVDTGTSVSLTMCDWDDGESYGLVLSFDPVLDASDLASKAYEAVVS